MGDPVVVGGLSPGGAVVWDAPGEADPVGATEPLGVADGLTDGDRDGDGDGDGDRDGLGDVSVGLGDEAGDDVEWVFDCLVPAFSDAGIGRTR